MLTPAPAASLRGRSVGRPHIAAVLQRKGYVSSIKQAFDKYLAQGAPAYFDKERMSPKRALELVRQSGGLAVLAHPVQLRTSNDAELERVVTDNLDDVAMYVKTLIATKWPEDQHARLEKILEDFAKWR